ncbi:MAG: FoF1 ATP synthase subunit a [Chloroflexota bacterium]|nr:FoF1 ATP synthase subunit a [Chloroflexota bacterium]
MDFKTILKTRRGRFGLIAIILGVISLCVLGLLPTLGVLQKGTLPEISLAAEKIPLPFLEPIVGKHAPLSFLGPFFLVSEEDHVPGIFNTLTATWLTMIILIGIGTAYYRAQRKEGTPSLFQVAMETVIEGMFGFVENIVGENAHLFFPLVATFFFFIAISNWCGILPGFGSIGVWAKHHGEAILVPILRSANAHLSTTLALGTISVVATQYFGFKLLGTSFMRRYINFKPSSPESDGTAEGLQATVGKIARVVEAGANGIVGLLELILEIIKVLPFSFRLFGNIVAGEVLLFVVSYLFAFIFPVIFLGLELFVGVIQALIFAMLTLVFTSMATTQHGEDSESSH